MVAMSEHCMVRAAQRSLSDDELEYVLAWGQVFHRAGVLICYLREKDLPPEDLRVERWRKLVGTAVVLARDGDMAITVWRNRRWGLKNIRCKVEYDRRGRDWQGQG